MLACVLVVAAAAARAALAPPVPAPVQPRLEPLPESASLAALDLSPAAGVYERRGVGLLVVDVKDSTPLHLILGNRRAHAAVAAALEYAEASAALFDGTVIRRLGDGQLIAFPRLQHALDAARAIQAGLPEWRRQAQAPALSLRAGVHAGRVVVDGTGVRPEIYGQAVERVLRLAGLSRGDDVAREDAAGRAVFELPQPRAPAAAVPGLQRRLVSARMVEAATLFAGLADWTQTYERYGRRLAYATVKAFHAHVAAVVERRGGFVVKTEGETVMASFPSAAAAVAAGAELQARMSEVRQATPLGPLVNAKVGITHGRILREDSLEGADFFGNRVNAAARLMSRAGPGEVVVSDSAAAQSAAAALAPGRKETVPIKGFPAAVDAFRLRPPVAAADSGAVERLRLVVEAALSRLKR